MATAQTVVQPDDPPTDLPVPPAPVAEPLAPAPEPGGSWFGRTVRRYFRDDSPAGVELAGQVFALADRYAAYAGRPIAVVIVHQVDRLRPDDATRSELMSSLARSLHPYTRESVLRQYLRFQPGEALDPLKLADSERLLRRLEYVADVRLHVVPLTGAESEVAVVVEILDRLPVGVNLLIRDVDRYEVGLFHSNVGGLGLRLAVDLFYRSGVTPETGWGTTLRKRNAGGSFVDAEVGYEDSWRALERRFVLSRAGEHPDIRWVGRLAWRDRLERDPARPYRRADAADAWVGRVIRRKVSDTRGAGARPVLVPALGYAYLHHNERPIVAPDTNLAWHDYRQLLAGLTWSRSLDYRTSHLEGFGETENISGGQGLKFSTAYIDGEFRDRTGLFLQGWRRTVRGRGDILNLGVDLGGYLRAGRLEDGALRVGLNYVSPLIGGDRWRSRLLAGLRYHRSVRAAGEGPLSLAGGLGPRGLDLSNVVGDQRLAADTEWRLFTPWVVYGFRWQFFAFADAALLADPGGPLTDQPLLASAGLGLRVGNPALVLPVLQVRVAFLRGMGDNAAGVVLAAEYFRSPATELPDARPGSFEFR